MNRVLMFLTVFLLATTAAGQVWAKEHASKPPELKWSFEGPFGTYDRAALQRGFKVYREVCASCHSMDRVYFRDLAALGYSPAQIKGVAASYMVTDGPNDEGEMFERAGLPSDHFLSPYPNKQAAAFANNGAAPPDMSLLIKARHDGPNYIYGILTGYGEPPEEVTIQPGQYWNMYMPGHVIAMPPPLNDGRVSYDDGSPENVAQYSQDVVQFLTWASEPHMEARKRAGIKAFLFLLVFAGVMYAVKRKIWADVH